MPRILRYNDELACPQPPGTFVAPSRERTETNPSPIQYAAISDWYVLPLRTLSGGFCKADALAVEIKARELNFWCLARRFDRFPHNDDFKRALKDKMPTLKVLPGRLPQQFAELLKDALGSSTNTLDRMNRWLRENPSSFQTGDLESVVSKIAKETGLSRRELAPLVSVIVNIGFYAESDEKFNDLLEDLRSIGFVESHLEAFGTLMAGVRFPKGEGTIAVTQSLATGVAQLSDVNVLCDLRAVFEASPDDEDNQDKITKLIALVPCVLLSLDVREESGRTKTVVIQFSDHAFAKFQQTLANASKQLDALREMAAASPEELSRRRSPQ